MIVAPLILLLGFGGHMAYCFAFADLYRFGVERSMYHWGGAVDPSLDEIERATVKIDKALRLRPVSADLLVIKARLLIWRSSQTGNALERERLSREAIVMVRKSLELRPIYPWSWAMLAELKASLGEKDAEFEAAVENALAYAGSNVTLIDSLIRL